MTNPLVAAGHQSLRNLQVPWSIGGNGRKVGEVSESRGMKTSPLSPPRSWGLEEARRLEGNKLGQTLAAVDFILRSLRRSPAPGTCKLEVVFRPQTSSPHDTSLGDLTNPPGMVHGSTQNLWTLKIRRDRP